MGDFRHKKLLLGSPAPSVSLGRIGQGVAFRASILRSPESSPGSCSCKGMWLYVVVLRVHWDPVGT
eukprot:8976257-Lingulodinium_polyedra.AAC.1